MFGRNSKENGSEEFERFAQYPGSNSSMDEYSDWWRVIGEREGYFFDAMVQECMDLDGSISSDELTFDTLMKQSCD